MRLTGIIEKAFGNFLCIRGFAQLEDLEKISIATDDSFQRDLIKTQQDKMKEFLESGEYTFFPELILSTVFTEEEITKETTKKESERIEREQGDRNKLFNYFYGDKGKLPTKFGNFTLKIIDKEGSHFKTATLDFDEANITKFFRIDGNHRLSAAKGINKHYNSPFCLLIFRDKKESLEKTRILFHNINSKQIPLTMEENYKVVIEGIEPFNEEILLSESFGKEYLLTRELLVIEKFDVSYFLNINKIIAKNKYTYFIGLFKYLIEHNILDGKNDIERLKEELAIINTSISKEGSSAFGNIAILGALTFYSFKNKVKYNSFLKWIKKNDISSIENLKMAEVISIYDNLYENIPKTVFLARWYPKDDMAGEKAEERVEAIREVVEGDFKLKLIDFGTLTGGSIPIRARMYEQIQEADIFIADLTGIRPNVMIEIGVALHHVGNERCILIHSENSGEKVPFDLSDFRYREFSTARKLKELLKKDLEKIIELSEKGEI